MDKIEWLDGMHKVDSKNPTESTQGETFYTLYIRDFLAMPQVEFKEISEIDPDIRALLN